MSGASAGTGTGTGAGARGEGRSRSRFTPRAAVLAIVIVGLLFYLLVPLKTYLAQRASLDQLGRQMQVLEQKNSELESRVNQLKDPAYLERLARECLAMVKPGEISFIIVPKGGSRPPPRC
jgi:cell division protein FtsB